MNIREANAELIKKIKEAEIGGYVGMFEGGMFTSSSITICLDGDFDIKELKAIVEIMEKIE